MVNNKQSNFFSKIINECSAIFFLLPFMAVFAIFYLWPIIRDAWISLHSWGMSGMKKFVGLENYIRLFKDNKFFLYIWHSFYFVILSVPIIIILGLILALIINEKIVARTAIRAIYFLPYVLSVSVVSYIWLRMFDANNGLVNAILRTLGLSQNIAWLTDERFAWWSIVITTAWWSADL